MNSEYSNPISKVTPHPTSPKKKKKHPILNQGYLTMLIVGYSNKVENLI